MTWLRLFMSDYLIQIASEYTWWNFRSKFLLPDTDFFWADSELIIFILINAEFLSGRKKKKEKSQE
ncbi:MAG TPA: hypothetical protein DCS91_07575 [Microcoleaceae bacterium UBA11344]|nr:hypothetical protein [Microcoleaceae cyanobacterium UBA11344]